MSKDLTRKRRSLPAKVPSLTKAWNHPQARPLVEVFGFAGSLLTLYQTLGTPGAIVGGVATLSYFGFQRYQSLKRQAQADETLLAELPEHLSFLVEFLRQTYSLPTDEVIAHRNDGLLVHHYVNSFLIKGSDCANTQRIVGRNTSTAPSRGLAFALVGGSSISSDELGAAYQSSQGPSREPEFLVDRDRFKVAFCEFDSPAMPQDNFDIRYADRWKGSMRLAGDGFFFPEPVFFPAGIHRLSSTIEIDRPLRSVAVMEVNVKKGSVKLCDSQPKIKTVVTTGASLIDWEVDSPPPDTVYVMYYSTGQSGDVMVETVQGRFGHPSDPPIVRGR